jgi:hypothetical protein
MKEALIGILSVLVVYIGIIIGFFLVFETVTAFTCLSMDGNLHWNKIVLACSFNETPIVSTQIIQTSSSSSQICYKNGALINCSEVIS